MNRQHNGTQYTHTFVWAFSVLTSSSPFLPPSLGKTCGLFPLLVFRIPEVAEKRRTRRAVTRRRAAVMRRARLLLFLLATTLLFFRHFRRAARRPPPVAVACTVHVGATTLLELDDFLKYHSAIHVGRFYLFVEGDARHRGHARLRSLARRYNALVIPQPKRDVETHRRSLSRKAFLQPYLENATACEGGASALFVRQTVHLEMAIELARRERIGWLVHIDADEALFPADSPTMDIRQVLSAVPPHIDRVVFPNHEAVPEGGKDSDPTTLFRKNHRTVDAAAYARYASLARGSNPNYFLAYANGKSAARINAASDLRAHGAHRFMSSIHVLERSRNDRRRDGRITLSFSRRRTRAAQSDAVRVHRRRFVFDAPFRSPSRASGERATREFRCILRRRRRRTKRKSKNGIIKGWVVRTHSRRRSHVETLKLNNSRYLRSSTSSFARFGVRRVAERDFLAPPFTFRRKERASDVHALDVARREPIRAVPLE